MNSRYRIERANVTATLENDRDEQWIFKAFVIVDDDAETLVSVSKDRTQAQRALDRLLKQDAAEADTD